MNNVFFKDLRGNYWAHDKIVGFVKDFGPTEEGESEVHYLAILEGGMSTEISEVMYNELTKSLITLEVATSEG